MTERTIQFTGYEIDRIIEFLTLIRGRRSSTTVLPKVVSASCQARATILSDDGMTKVFHVFDSEPEAIQKGYQRTLRFRKFGSEFELGGANAIREEWRLDHITFSYVTDAAKINKPDVLDWIEIVFPAPPHFKIDKERYDDCLSKLRLFVMSVYDCDARAELLTGLRDRIQSILEIQHTIMPEMQEAIGSVLCDLKDQTFVLRNVDKLHRHGSLTYMPTLLRHLFGKAELVSDIRATVATSMLVKINTDIRNEDERLSGEALSETNYIRHKNQLEDALKKCAVLTEAISFASSINREIYTQLVIAIESLADLQERRFADSDIADSIASALCAVMLSYAKLHAAAQNRDDFHMFKTSDDRVRSIVRACMLRGVQNSADVNRRIAGMATLALITSVDEVSESLPAVISAIDSVTKAHVRDSSDREAVVAAGADACGLLFGLPWPRGATGGGGHSSPRDEAATAIAKHWNNTSSNVVRRACARNLSEGLYRGVTPASILKCLDRPTGFRAIQQSLTRAERGSLRYYREKREKEKFPIDLPSQALLLALDDWELLPNLEISEEYKDHYECSTLSQALLDFVTAETHAKLNIQRARQEFAVAATSVRKLPETFLSKDVTEKLAQGIEARALCCALGDPNSETDKTILAAAGAFGSLFAAMTVPENHPSDPDSNFAEAMDALFSGIALSEYWTGAKDWPPQLTRKFNLALDCAPKAGSITFSEFCEKSLRPLIPKPPLPALDIPEGPPPPVGHPIDILAPIRMIASLGIPLLSGFLAARRLQDAMGRVRQLVPKLREFPMRPVGIIAVARALQW